VQLYYFVLKAGRQIIPDQEGRELPDEVAARAHAVAVAQQLMQHREMQTRNWRIQVCDDYLKPLFEVYFAEVGETLKGFSLHLQDSIKDVARTAASLDDALLSMRTTLTDVHATLGRADQILGSMPRVRL